MQRLAANPGIKAVLGKTPARAARYLLVGGLAWLTDLAVFALSMGTFGVVSAQLAARIVGGLVAFLGHRFLVFDEPGLQHTPLATQGLRYAALWVLSFAVSTAALVGLIDHAGLPPLITKVGVEVGIVAMNFLIMGAFVFRPPRKCHTSTAKE